MAFLGGLSLKGLGKGFADGINAEAAMEAQYKLAVGQSTASARATLAMNTEASELARTVDIGSFNYIDPEDGITKKHEIKIIKSDDPDEKSRNVANLSSVMDASNEVIGGKSVLQWINDTGDGPLANSLITEYGKWMHPIIRESQVNSDSGGFTLKEIYPFINDPFWSEQTRNMVRNTHAGHVIPGDFNFTGNGYQHGEGTIFPYYSAKIDDFKKTYWDVNDSEQKLLARDPKTTEIDLRELAYKWNRSQPNPYKNPEEVMENFLFGLSNTDENEGGIDRTTAITIALDLKPILGNGYQDVMRSTQKRRALMTYIGNLAKNGIFIDDPQQLTEIFGYYFTDDFQDSATQKGFYKHIPYKQVAEGMGIKKPELLSRAAAMVAKPIQRINRIIELAGKDGEEGTLPMGAIRSITLFSRGITEVPGQAKSGIGSILSGLKNSMLNMISSDQFDFIEGSKDGLTKDMNDLEQLAKTNHVAYQGLVDKAGSVEELQRLYDIKGKGGLTTAERAIIDGTRDAIIAYHTFLLAFEMAGAVQGGGDSRTISDKDVRIMRLAIQDRFFSSSKDFLAVLKEIRAELKGTLTVNQLWTNSSATQSIKGLKAAKLFEVLYNDMRADENPLRAYARKWTNKTVAQLEQEAEDRETKTETTDSVIEDGTVPEVPEGPVGGYKNFTIFANILSGALNADSTEDTIKSYQGLLREILDSGKGYVKEHFENALTPDVYSILFPPEE